MYQYRACTGPMVRTGSVDLVQAGYWHVMTCLQGALASHPPARRMGGQGYKWEGLARPPPPINFFLFFLLFNLQNYFCVQEKKTLTASMSKIDLYFS